MQGVNFKKDIVKFKKIVYNKHINFTSEVNETRVMLSYEVLNIDTERIEGTYQVA